MGMLAFTLSRENYVGVSDAPLAAGSPVWLLYALLLGGLFWLALERRARPTAGTVLLGLLFGAINYFATTLFAYDTWSFLSTARAWVLAGLCILGQAAVMTAVLSLTVQALEHAKGDTVPSPLRPLSGALAALGCFGGRLLDGINRRFVRLAAWRRRHPLLAGMIFSAGVLVAVPAGVLSRHHHLGYGGDAGRAIRLARPFHLAPDVYHVAVWRLCVAGAAVWQR